MKFWAFPTLFGLWDGPGHHGEPPGVFGDVEEFVAAHRRCGTLTGGAGDPTADGYLLWIACSCGAEFERLVTPEAAEYDLLRSLLLTSQN